MEKNTNAKPNKFQLFFWWCSGAVPSILRRYPNEWGRQTALGIFVFIVALLATLAMFEVLSGILQVNGVAAFIGSLFWGFTILSLDRIFLTNYRKGKDEFRKVVYRIAVTVVCSLLITDMAMLGLLRGDINTKIEMRKVEGQKEIKQNVLTQAENDELGQLKKSEAGLQLKLDQLNQSVQEKLEIRDAEGRGDKVYIRADGTEVQLSGKPSHAREYTERNKEYEAAKTSLDMQQDENKNGGFAGNLKRIREQMGKFTKRQEDAEQLLKNAQNTTRLLEMHNALSAVLWDEKSGGAFYAFMLLWLVLILLESAPILQKVATRKSRYEQALNSEDNKALRAEDFDTAAAAFFKQIYKSFNESRGAANAALTPKQAEMKQYLENEMTVQHKTEIALERHSDGQAPAFEKKIILQVAGEEHPAGSIRIPSAIEPRIHFDDLAVEVEAIEERVRLKKGDVELVKITNSAGKAIDRDFTPLLRQIEDDGVLILHFKPCFQVKDVTI